MPKPVKIGDLLIGPGEPCFIVAEIGINHNGDVGIAKNLIAAAQLAQCQAVKFQKRTVEVVYTPEELDRERESPFGETNRILKESLEFGESEYREIDRYCRDHDMLWFASGWDEGSVHFIERFDPPCYKIASATLTDGALLRRLRATGRPLILSTGMSTMELIRAAVDILGTDNLLVAHCTSTYPCPAHELNLRMIETLRREFECPVGYSGHEVGLPTSVAAVALGACLVERHITLDRAMWGSDQGASVEPGGMERLVRHIRAVEQALGNGVKQVYESELPVMQRLRRLETLQLPDG